MFDHIGLGVSDYDASKQFFLKAQTFPGEPMGSGCCEADAQAAVSLNHSGRLLLFGLVRGLWH